jgi:hypothetical protein
MVVFQLVEIVAAIVPLSLLKILFVHMRHRYPVSENKTVKKRIPEIKHAEKWCQTGLLKLNFEIIPEKRIFRFCQKFSQAMGKLNICFCQFPNPWALGVSGKGCATSKCEKPKSIHPTICIPGGSHERKISAKTW